MRVVLSILAGSTTWGILWSLGTRAAHVFFPNVLVDGEPITAVPALIGYIVYSAALSVLAGYVAAVVKGRNPMIAVWLLAVMQLGLGIVAEVSYWDLMPVWYHMVFLATVVPATVAGGYLRGGQRMVPITA